MADTLTKTENIVFGRGVLYFAPFDDNDVPMGERDLGETPGFSITAESERFKKYSSRSGISTLILDQLIRVDLSGKIAVDDMSAENQALFIAGNVQTKTQSASPVTNERIYYAISDRYYQLGASDSNPSGVRGVSSVTIGLYELVNAVARTNSQAYALGDIFKSGSNVFLVTTAGTTAGSAPSYTTTAVGDSTVDGTATVKFLGTTSNYTVDTHYALDTVQARIGIVPDANLGLACDLYFAVTGDYLSLNAGYTPDANSRLQIVTTGAANTRGQLRFKAANAVGKNRDLFIASCSLQPSGESQFITAGETQAFELEVGVNSKADTIPQIIIDGRPADF